MSDEIICCPSCDCPRVLAFNYAAIEACGSDHDTVQIVYVRPLLRCLNEACGQIWSNHEGEQAQEEALARYRRALRVPVPDIRQWIARVQGRALAGLSHEDIERVVESWELYRKTMMEAGAGIEPTRSGI